MTFVVVSGAGKVWATHNGDPANLSPYNASWNQAYYGLARAFIRSSADHASAPHHRQRMREIDLESTVYIAGPDDNGGGGGGGSGQAPSLYPIVVEVHVDGLPSARLEIPVTADRAQLPLAVADRAAREARTRL
jgi:hypothetical protein